MVNLLVCVLTNIFRVYLIRRFIKIFCFEKTVSKYKEIIGYSTFFIITTAVYWTFQNVWLNLMVNILGMMILVSMHTKELRKIFFVSFASYIINMGCDAIMVMIFVEYQPGRIFNQLYEVITDCMILVCVVLTESVVDRKNDEGVIINIPLLFIPLTSIIVLSFLIKDTGYTNYSIIIASMGILIMNFWVFYLYNLLKNNFFRRIENDRLKQKIQVYSKQIDFLLQGEEKINLLKHDMRHHITELNIMVEKNQTLELKKYLQKMTDFISSTQKETISSGNKETDCLLNYLLEKAKQKLKIVKTTVILPEGIKHSFDLNIVVGNLLENAIEASEISKEKYLELFLKYEKGVLKLKICNSFSGNLKIGEKGLMTSKKNQENHGIGMSSVKKIVEKHKGILKYRVENNRFEVQTILYLQEDIN